MEHPVAELERTSAALGLLERDGAAFRRTARRLSLCADDAEDAYQRAIEILLTKAPSRAEPGRLAAWMQVVTRREALAVRRERERLLAGGTLEGCGDGRTGAERFACARAGPDECAERRERIELSARLLAELKPDERLAIVLQAFGYSYAEIAAACGWTYTKVNRCLAEGRARLRELASAGEDLKQI